MLRAPIGAPFRRVPFPLGAGDEIGNCHGEAAGVLDTGCFREDCLPAPGPGTNACYGHRSDPHNSIAATFDQYINPAVRATGCTYEGVDTPGLTVLPGHNGTWSVTFKHRIIDVCQDNAVVADNEWHWTCGGAVPAGASPDPALEWMEEVVLAGRRLLVAAIAYDDDVLAVTVAIDGVDPVDANNLTVVVPDLDPPLTVPKPGQLPMANLRNTISDAMYTYDYPPGSPVNFVLELTFDGQGQNFAVELE